MTTKPIRLGNLGLFSKNKPPVTPPASKPEPVRAEISLPVEEIEIESDDSEETIQGSISDEAIVDSVVNLPTVIEPTQVSEIEQKIRSLELSTARQQGDNFAEPKTFRELLDSFDNLCNLEGGGLDQFNIDTARNYATVIFTTLKQYPELDSILISKDVRNVMAFAYAQKDLAQATIEQKVEKKQKRVAKAKAGAIIFEGGLKFE